MPIIRIIAFDDERLSLLEKRQSSWFDDNENAKCELAKRIRYNDDMIKAMDRLLERAAVVHIDEPAMPEDLCDAMQSKCKIEPESVRNFVMSGFNM